MPFLIFILGLVLGSFLSAYTYRAPLGKSISHGRSVCPNCHKQIQWFDNIPLFSYLFLKGKCRNCHKKISPRYPLIELFTALILALVYHNFWLISANLTWTLFFPIILTTSYLLLITSLCVVIIITDLEHQIILDETIFIGYLATIFLLNSHPDFYYYFLGGFIAAFALLFLHLITRGRGMGLGDVKLALFIGTIFGIKASLIWLFLAFSIGSIIGIILIAFGTKKLKSRIAFGPFLALAFFLYLFFGSQITNLLFPL